MSDALSKFFSAWATADAAAIHASMAGEFTYADPRTPLPITDAAALADYVAAFSANAPGWGADVIKMDEVQGYTRATVAFGGAGPDGQQMVQHGQYFAQTDAEGCLTLLVGFVGTGAPE